MSPCEACEGSGFRGLPTEDGVEDFPCPTCRPWPLWGFPGEKADGRWITEPAKPGESAIYHGWELSEWTPCPKL